MTSNLFLNVYMAQQPTFPPQPPAPANPPAEQPAHESLSAGLGVYVFQAKNQIPEHQNADEGFCFSWAKDQAGIDPMGSPHPAFQSASTQQQAQQSGPDPSEGSGVKGAADGAAAGAASGAIAGDAGESAAIGATEGAMKGRRERRKAKKQAQAQQQQAHAQAEPADSQKFRQQSLLSMRGGQRLHSEMIDEDFETISTVKQSFQAGGQVINRRDFFLRALGAPIGEGGSPVFISPN
jgi:hypothetical protein